MQPTVFISYARGDDEPFVARLHADLSARGFDVWWDRISMPARGLTFLHEIREAIDARERFILVIGPKAVASDYVIAEWQHAITYGKAINPILRLDDYHLVPDELKPYHVEDFRDDTRYTLHLKNLIRQLAEPVRPMGKLVSVPSLPRHVLARAEQIRSLKETLLADLKRPKVVTGAAARVGMHGMGGIGKSVLANLVARDIEVRRAFKDGIVWVPFGTQPNVVELQRNAAKAFVDDPGIFENVAQGRTKLSDLLRSKEILLVLDDVWERAHADAFDVLGPNCRALITTRDAGLVNSLGSTPHPVQLLAEAESLSLLAGITGLNPQELPAEAKEIVAECGYLPLAVALSGAMIRDIGWSGILERLKASALEYIASEHPEHEQHRNLWVAMKVSVDALTPEEQERFIELSVFPNDKTVVESAITTLWAHTGGLTKFVTQDLVSKLARRSLIRIDVETPQAEKAPIRQVSLHALLFDFITKRAGDPIPLQKQLLEAYRKLCPSGWARGPNDGYFLQNIVRHLSLAGEPEEFAALLEDEKWRQRKRDFDPSLSSYLADLQIGLDRAEAAEPPDYPALAAFSLVAARAKEQVQDVPLEALFALSRLGKWRQALAYVPSIEPPERRLYALRQMAELLREIGEGDAFRTVAGEALVLAEKLDPTLAQFDPTTMSVEKALLQLEEKCAADGTTTVLDLVARYFTEADLLEQYKADLAKLDVLDTRFVLLAPPSFLEVTIYQWERAFREALPGQLASVNFPRADDPTPKDYELASLDVITWMAPAAARKINLESVRCLAGEVWALLDQPERALSLVAQSRQPMARFPAMAVAAQAFGRAGHLEPVKRIWGMLKELDSVKYAGAAAERCGIMLRMVGAFLQFRDEELAKLPMGAAIGFAIGFGLLDESPSAGEDSADRMLRHQRRRQFIEDQVKDYGGHTALAAIQTRAQVQEALLEYWAEDGTAIASANSIRRHIEKATAETWHLKPAQFQREQAMAFCTLGTVLFRVGKVDEAEAAWRRAIDLAEKIKNINDRARVLAVAADAFALARWHEPAESFARQFLWLMRERGDAYLSRERLVERWSVACVEAGRIEEGIDFAQRAENPAPRLDALASAALALAHRGDAERAKEIISAVLETTRASVCDVREARVMAKAIALFGVLKDAATGERTEKEVLSLLDKVKLEPDRLDALIAFIDTLNREGEGQRAVALIQACEDKATRGIMIAAGALSVATDAAHLAESDFVNIANWGLGFATTEMNPFEYHTPLALLLLSEALRFSGMADEVATSSQFKGDLEQAVTLKALEQLAALHVRDGDVGLLRCFNVFRVAARLSRLAPKWFETQPWPELWKWVQSQRTLESPAIIEPIQFFDALRAARSEDTHAVWKALWDAGPFLVSANALESTWIRIESAVNAQSQQKADADDAASLTELVARGAQKFREIAQSTARSDYRDRHARKDAQDRPPARGDLVKAARSTDEARVLRLLERGADINDHDEQGTTALMHAVVLDLDQMVRLLLARGADPNRANDNGESALLLVKEPAIAKLLIEAGGDVNLRTPKGKTPVGEALRSNLPEVLKLLLENGACLPVDEPGVSQLFLAIADDQIEIVKLLVKHGANITLPGAADLTPLMFAAVRPGDAMVRALVEGGAPVDGKGPGGGTALMIAASQANEAALRALLEVGALVDRAMNDGINALILAASKGTVEIVRILLDYGADIEKAKANGRTALGVAAAEGHGDVVRALLDRGADANRPQDEHGATSLMYAAAAGHLDVLAALIAHGVSIDQTTPNGWTALMSAVWNNQIEAAKWIVSHGADVSHATNSGVTALAIALENDNHAIASCLVWREVP